MSVLTVQQQPIIKRSFLPKIPQNRVPIVHVLTSRTESDVEQVWIFEISRFFSLLGSLSFQKVEPFPFEKTIKFLLDPHSVKKNKAHSLKINISFSPVLV